MSTNSTRSNMSRASTASSSRMLNRARSSTTVAPTTASRYASATVSSSASAGPRSSPRRSSIPPPKTMVIQKLKLACSDEHKEATVDQTLVQELKEQYELAELGVQELLRPTTTASSATTPTRSDEVRRLRSGIKNLSGHSDALLLACEALQRRQHEQDEEMHELRRMNEQLVHELHQSALTAASFSGSTSFVLPTLPQASTPSSTPAESPASAHSVVDDGSEEKVSADPPPEADMGRRLSADSSLSAFVNEMLRKATEKIEEKWKARFAEQVAEHERALAQERERSSASVMSNSRLVTETKHEKEDELKALREENVNVKLENKQMTIEMAALRKDLEYVKQQLADQDEIRQNSASFWQKTTDLARQNRTLTEELTLTQQSLTQLNESMKDIREQNVTLRAENLACVRKTHELEVEKQVLADKLTAVEAKFEDEKSRREQFQVNVEQLTVENTALYAQMVAIQTTHEAKMEELRASFEKRNTILAGEMRALQTQNMLMRKVETQTAEHATKAAPPSPLTAQAEEELNGRLQQMTDELLAVRQELVARTDQIADLERKMAEGELLRRKMHNTIQELRGNIRVHVRVRPFLRSDGSEGLAENPRPAIRCDSFGSTISTTTPDKLLTFGFDKVYLPSDSQEAVFKDVSDFIQSAMDGYNVCIFAYGQTGSGKTHTMQGSGKAQMRGIIPRSIQLIIQTCKELSTQGWEYSLEVTFFEIYNETLRDLLTVNGAGDDRKFNIRTDRRGKNYVEGLTTIPIDFAYAEEQVEEIVNLAACNRSVDKTDMNAHSSRSHSIFGLTIRGYNDAQQTEMEGSLSLVDLAGSERLSRSNATGERLKEAQAINKSLSALADVFQALAKKSPHVPYRNSKLTYVLQPALSGDGKTLMMVNLSPTMASLDESICSLRFAQNVSQCELGAPTRQLKQRSASVPSTSSSSALANVSLPQMPAGLSTPVSARSSPARFLTPTTGSRGGTTSSNGASAARPNAAGTATPPIAKKLFM
ncbi:hypothetical protein PINS_up004002 [Pythium insidiosum]|nr:hypothetical protein PINS_up004002 [Pythium insidiosum]